MNLESPLLGGDLGVGKAVIRENMERNPPPNPSQEGNRVVSSQDLSACTAQAEGNNPCHPVTRINKMKHPIQSSSITPFRRNVLCVFILLVLAECGCFGKLTRDEKV